MFSTFFRTIGGTLFLLLIFTACAFSQEEERRRGSRGSFDAALQAGFDDQPLGIARDAYFQEAALHLSLQQDRGHGHWLLDYRPTFRHYDHLSVGDQVDHEVQVEGKMKFSRRWSIELHSRYLDTSDPFLRNEEFLPTGETGSPPPLGPNLGLVGPARAYRAINSSLTLHYELGPHARLNFGTDYLRDDEKDAALLSNDMRALRAGFEKRLGPRDTAEILYSLQLFRVAVASTRVQTQSVLFVYGHEWRSRLRLDIFAGPQFSLLQADPTASSSFLFFQLPASSHLSQPTVGYATGASLTRRLAEHASFEIGYSHRIADGGGITGPLVQDSARLGVRQKLKRHIEVALTSYYTYNRAPGGISPSTAFPTWSVSPEIDFGLTRNTSITAAYNFSRYVSAPPEFQWLQQHNRVVVGFRYSFGSFPLFR